MLNSSPNRIRKSVVFNGVTPKGNKGHPAPCLIVCGTSLVQVILSQTFKIFSPIKIFSILVQFYFIPNRNVPIWDAVDLYSNYFLLNFVMIVLKCSFFITHVSSMSVCIGGVSLHWWRSSISSKQSELQ